MRDKVIRVLADGDEIDEIDAWMEMHGLVKEGRAAALRIMANAVMRRGIKPSGADIQKGVRRKLEKKDKT